MRLCFRKLRQRLEKECFEGQKMRIRVIMTHNFVARHKGIPAVDIRSVSIVKEGKIVFILKIRFLEIIITLWHLIIYWKN